MTLNANDSNKITPEGLQKLQEKLKNLEERFQETVKRRNVAREYGDLRENAEYSMAIEEIQQLNKLIQDIQVKLENVQVIKNVVVDKQVVFGSTVTLEELTSKAKKKYQIVGDDEASIEDGKLSEKSEFAKTLLGKFKGETFCFSKINNIKKYKILDVKGY